MHTRHHITATHGQTKLRQTQKNNYKTPASFVQHPGPLQLSLFTQNAHVTNADNKQDTYVKNLHNYTTHASFMQHL
jgi:hypothetical protein